MTLVRKAALALISLLVTALTVEGLFRLWLTATDQAYDAQATAEQVLALAHPSDGFVPEASVAAEEQPPRTRSLVLHPYTGSELVHDSGGVLEYFRERAQPEHFTVLVLGGSFAASFGNEPLLRETLQALPPMKRERVRVLNYAHAAFKQPQQLMRLAYLFSLGYRPDAVINLDGFNEVSLALQGLPKGVHPLYPQYIRWGVAVEDLDNVSDREMERRLALFQLSREADELARETLDWGLHRSSLLGRLSLSRLRALTARTYALLQQEDEPSAAGEVNRQVQGPDFDHDRRAVLELCATNWVESSLSMQALCDARGIPYLHILQPTLHDRGAKSRSDEERALPLPNKAWLQGARAGYPLLREHVTELVAAGVQFRDASALFADEPQTLFIDACHVNNLGNRLLVPHVVGWLAEVLD